VPYIRNYTHLDVWSRSHALTISVYRLTQSFPPHERFGLAAQLRRACSSVPANLAEGKERSGARAFASFVDIAAASAAETDYQLLLARDLGYIDTQAHASLAEELGHIRRMLTGLRNRLRSSSPVSPSRA
jgi:four helix bundle protein